MREDLDLYGGDPAIPSTPMTYRQGIIMSWNPVTLENLVDVGGTPMLNLPLLGVAEADSYSAGDAVGIMCAGKTWAIVGRFVVPDTPEADEATALLSRRTQSASIITQETTSSATFTDLPTTVGPAVTVVVRNTGRLHVALGCQIQRLALVAWGGSMTAEFSGANVIDAATFAATLNARFWQSIIAGGTFTETISPYSAAVIDGLTPGETTITAKYRSLEPAQSVDIGRRSLTVTVL